MNRRMFGKAAGAFAVGRILAVSKVLAQSPKTEARPAPEPAADGIIDTHTHFYDPTRKEGVPWPTKGSTLYRPVYPADWKTVARPFGVTQTVVVEASPWLEDNQWILDLAEKDRSIAGLIGNLDPADDRFPEHLKRFTKNPLFRGIRWRGDKVPADVANETFLARAKSLADHQMVLELNGGPSLHLQAAKIARQFPTLKIMIDHVGLAGDAQHLSKEWLESIKTVAERPNVSIKISALTEQTRLSDKEFGHAPRELYEYLPILNHCWTQFGDKRLLYGSDWPVCEKGGSYGDQFAIVKAYFDFRGKDAAANYFKLNAQKFYGLKT